MIFKLILPEIVTLDFKTLEDAKEFRRGIGFVSRLSDLEDLSELENGFFKRGARFADILKLFCRIERISFPALEKITIKECK